MRALLLSLICITACASGWSQPFLGLYGSQNSIIEVRDNPAFVVSDDRAQINIGSLGGMVGGNSIVFKPSALGNYLGGNGLSMDNDYYRSYDTHQKSFFGDVEAMGPGASFIVKKKYSFGISTGVRYLVNSDNLDPGVYNMMGVNAPKDSIANDSFKVHNYSLAAQVFRELNISYAGYIYQSEERNLIGGVTLKILDGMGAAGMGITDASFKTHNNDGIAYGATGNVNVAFTPYANTWAISNNPFQAYNNRTNNLGVGVDLGLVYYLNPNEGMMLKKGYSIRLAASITDIGSIKYNASSTTGSYALNNSNINYRGIQNNSGISYGNRIFNDYLVDTVATSKSSSSKFKVHLPTAFHFNADMKIERLFFVNANLLLNLVSPSADKYANHYISTLTITPRYMIGRGDFGLGLPFSFNAQKQGYVGIVAYLGPVFIGSGGMYEMLTSSSIYNESLYAGVTWRVKPKHKKMKDIMMM